jgi:RimJ/RimL family protein N-acetyltransferase
MKSLDTPRLTLRPFVKTDFDAVHSYASNAANIVYMPWGPNDRAQTEAFIYRQSAAAAKDGQTEFPYAVVLKENGHLIGGCELSREGKAPDTAELGWVLHMDYWKRGLAREIGRALLAFGFDGLGLRRIIAVCDAENYGSYRVMEKIGMRREALLYDARPANKERAPNAAFSDELVYAILRDDWEVAKETAYYNALPTKFDGFIDVPMLSDGEIYLVCERKQPADPEKKLVPSYKFIICAGGEKVGNISLRIGYTDGLYYGGQIGYNVDEAHRGKGYAGRACRLAARVARAHGMEKLLITNKHTNDASQRVCEKLGARLVRVARIPEWSDLYKDGNRYENIFEWDIRH